ncbi:MAG: class I SAM-dependent methyltransferase [Rickettsiales bacterium]|jgi:ubiquinone/menaquinone biosynthesis C-methylase UbiE|nr:class I SAM-dependent methyltransferase [Rickettsiales bacterium]
MSNKTDITIKTYNSIVDEYEVYFKTRDLNGGVQFQKEIDYLVSKLPAGASILDAGTATGDYPRYLTECVNKKFQVIGIDASNDMIKCAKTKAPKANFQVVDIRKLEFQKKSFDAIICFATLIHVNDFDALSVMKNFDLILKDNGFIAINVFEQKINQEKEIFIDEPFNPKYKTYFNHYTKDFFRKWFVENEYKICEEFDNGVFNPEIVTEVDDDVNQFSIIAHKIR